MRSSPQKLNGDKFPEFVFAKAISILAIANSQLSVTNTISQYIIMQFSCLKVFNLLSNEIKKFSSSNIYPVIGHPKLYDHTRHSSFFRTFVFVESTHRLIIP